MPINNTTYGINISQEFQSGFGPLVNGAYVMPSSFQQDLDYLWSIGFRKVRIAAQSFNGYPPIIDLQDRAALLAVAKGFSVDYGTVNKNPSTPTDWGTYLPTVPAKAIWAQNNGISVFMIGNEHDGYGATTYENLISISRTSNVVTVTTATSHNLKPGDSVEIYNNTILLYFVSVLATPTTTTFTVTSVGSNGSENAGIYRYGPGVAIRLLKELATSLKTTHGITIPLSYSMVQGNQTGSTQSVDWWIIAGRGDIDFLDQNIYGTGSTQDLRLTDFNGSVTRGYNAFGANYRVTEWNIFHDNTGVPSITADAELYLMKRREILESKAGLVHFIFCYKHAGNLLILKKPSTTNQAGRWRDWWWSFIKERQSTIELTSGTPTPVNEYRSNLIARFAVSNKLAMNYGQDTQGGVYNTAQINEDLEKMWDMGIRKLRIASSNYTYTAGVNTSKTLALAAKARGFYIIWGVSHPPGTLSDAGWAAYTSEVNSAADWAEINGVDEFNIGNELEYLETTYTILTNSVSKIKTMATDVKTHFSRIVSYAMAQSSKEYQGAPSGWIASGKGDIDLLGYNIYGDNGLTIAQGKTQFETRITDLYTAFGAGLYISEWNIGTGTLWGASDTERGVIITERLDFMLGLGISVFYFFTFRWDNAGTNDKLYFPAILGSIYRSWINKILILNVPIRSIAPQRLTRTTA